jgi:hypothetical protein
MTSEGAFSVGTTGALCQGQIVGDFASEVCTIANNLRCIATYKRLR